MMTRLTVQFWGGPLDGEWAVIDTAHGVVRCAGHRYRVAQDSDGSYVLVYCGEAVAAPLMIFG